jgi:hypothetical protein
LAVLVLIGLGEAEVIGHEERVTASPWRADASNRAGWRDLAAMEQKGGGDGASDRSVPRSET